MQERRSDRHADVRDLSLFLLVCLFGLGVAVLGSGSSLSADPTVYRDRVAELFDGSIPYLDTRFEHLPLSLVPMIGAWVLGGFKSAGVYTVVFAVLMGACLWGVMRVLSMTGHQVGITNAGRRWLIMTAPIFPLVLFRSDPWPVLLATGAVWAMVVQRESKSLTLAILAVLAKGWPVVLVAIDWWRGRRKRAILVLVITVAMAGALLLTPGFRSGRAFSGIHSETLVGGLLGLARAVAGLDVGLQGSAGATYIVADRWMVALQAILGIALLFVGIRRLRRQLLLRQTIVLAGLLVSALLVGSPLLSAQFILWPLPFFVFQTGRRVAVWGLLLSGLTLAVVLFFRSAATVPVLFFSLVTARNAVLIGLYFMVLTALDREQ